MENKKGSHVGMMLSFLIFVTFLIFIFSILTPTRNSEGKEVLLDFIENQVTEQITSNLTVVTVNPQGLPGGTKCVNLYDDYFSIKGPHTVAKDKYNNILTTGIYSQGYFAIDTAEAFNMYYSDELTISHSNFGGNCRYITVGTPILTKTNDYVFESKLVDFINSLEIDYQDVKSDLQIPADTELSVSFVNSTNGITGKSEVDFSGNIYVREMPIQYVDKLANIKTGFINLKIW